MLKVGKQLNLKEFGYKSLNAKALEGDIKNKYKVPLIGFIKGT